MVGVERKDGRTFFFFERRSVIVLHFVPPKDVSVLTLVCDLIRKQGLCR